MSDDGNDLPDYDARLAVSLRNRYPTHTEKRIAQRLATAGVEVDCRTIRNWISETNPQWPSSKHFKALVRVLGLQWVAEIFTEDPVSRAWRAKTLASLLEAELTEALRRLERLKGDGE